MDPLRLSTFRIGDPPSRAGALRIGVVRRPPRGVARARWTKDGSFDVWFPAVAPSLSLLSRFRPQALSDPAIFRRFASAYARELQEPEARQTVELLAALAARMPIAIGCYCDDEGRCHRSILKRTIEGAAP
jgi:uncharacterized protein YeaO (DUF488 family)